MDEIAPIKIFAIAAELVKFGFYIASSLQKNSRKTSAAARVVL